jgi:hypothetical protein
MGTRHREALGALCITVMNFTQNRKINSDTIQLEYELSEENVQLSTQETDRISTDQLPIPTGAM